MLVPIADRANMLTNKVGSNVGQHGGTVCEGLDFDQCYSDFVLLRKKWTGKKGGNFFQTWLGLHILKATCTFYSKNWMQLEKPVNNKEQALHHVKDEKDDQMKVVNELNRNWIE